MALNRDAARNDDIERGGRHFAEPPLQEEIAEHVTGIRRGLTEEARDARNAGRRLESEGTDADIIGVVKKLQEAVIQQGQSNERIRKQMEDMLYQMREIVMEFESIKKEEGDSRHTAQQMALMGVNQAQKSAEEITIRNIDEATRRSQKAIDTMVQESKRRIERLAMITLPDKLFNFCKWTVMVLLLFILSHVAWQMVA